VSQRNLFVVTLVLFPVERIRGRNFGNAAQNRVPFIAQTFPSLPPFPRPRPGARKRRVITRAVFFSPHEILLGGDAEETRTRRCENSIARLTLRLAKESAMESGISVVLHLAVPVHLAEDIPDSGRIRCARVRARERERKRGRDLEERDRDRIVNL